MKIDSFAVSMSSLHSSFKSQTREESLKIWVGDRRRDFSGRQSGLSGMQPVIAELSEQARALLAWEKKAPEEAGPAEEDGVFTISEQDRAKISLIEQMIESITGKKFKFHLMEKIELSEGRAEIKKLRDSAPEPQQRQGWGLEYDRRETYYEQERLSFAARGVVRTADGREINFSLNLKMSREFSARSQVGIRAGDAALDPLAINFDGAAPGLEEARFSFDLNADGKEELVSFVRPGSGFLAIDLNGDGRVNDGRELFGPSSGDGFADLAAYDQDGNLWIDENDPVYDRLRIWTRDGGGGDVLASLGEMGVGAIYLGRVRSSFDLNGTANVPLGKVGQSGVYLAEDGTAGTVQQIDLVV